MTLISPARISNLKLQNELPLCQEGFDVSGIELFVLLGFGHWTTLFNQMSTAAQNHTKQRELKEKEIAQNSMTLLHLVSTGCNAEKNIARSVAWWLLCKHTVYVTGMIWREKRMNRVFLAFKTSSLTAQHALQASPGLKAHSLKQHSLASRIKHSPVARSFLFKLNKLTPKLSNAVPAPCLSDKLQNRLIGEEMED